MTTQSRSWCFTVNNPDSQLTPDIDWPADSVRYCIWQMEIGENNTQHYQGYIELSRNQRLTWIKRLAGLERAHIEPRRGSREQARAYCQKEESRVDGFWEYGSFEEGGRGRRNDVAALKELINNGKTELEIFDAEPAAYVRYYRAIGHIQMLLTKPRDFKTTFEFYYGKPGLGKSRKAFEENPSAYWKQRSNWWDGYTNNQVTIVDEFYGWLTPDFIFRLTDRYPMMIETKGGQKQFISRKVIIISNKLPQEWWNQDVWSKIDPEALYRRMDRICHFEKDSDSQETVVNEYSNWPAFITATFLPIVPLYLQNKNN